MFGYLCRLVCKCDGNLVALLLGDMVDLSLLLVPYEEEKFP